MQSDVWLSQKSILQTNNFRVFVVRCIPMAGKMAPLWQYTLFAECCLGSKIVPGTKKLVFCGEIWQNIWLEKESLFPLHCFKLIIHL